MGTRDTTELFFSLTPEKVLQAVEAADLHCNAVCYPLNSFENRVYEVELVDRTRIVAKFYRPGRWSRAQILEEHEFLAELEAEELPVCNVRPFPDGSTLKTIDNIHYSLSDRRGGRAPDEIDDPTAERLGMLIARLHNVGARHRALHRWRLGADRYIRDNLEWLLEQSVLPEHVAQRYVETASAIADILDARSQGVATQRLHGDLHVGNLLFRNGRLRLLDFDDMVMGPAVQDLWLAIPGRDDDSLRRREILLRAYEQLRAFDRATLLLIEPLRGLRIIHYAAWLARRWDDPAFKAAWPHFGTRDYWERETDDLVEQLRVIREEDSVTTRTGEVSPLVRRGDEEETVLSNKDYFWDWEGD